MKRNHLLLGGYALLLGACRPTADAPPPADITGTWSGTIGDMALFDLTLTESSTPRVLTGTAFAVSLSHTSLLNVSGSGSIEDGYELSLSPPHEAFELRIVGSLSGDGFSGTYDLPLGPARIWDSRPTPVPSVSMSRPPVASAAGRSSANGNRPAPTW